MNRGGEVRELFLATEPTPSWPIAQLGNVGNIGVLATRVINIPKSPESDVFFEFLKDFNVVTDLPRTKNTLTLLYDGEPVIYNAYAVKNEYANGVYKIALTGRNAELINSLSGDLRSIDFSDFNVDNSINTINSLIDQDPISNVGCLYAYYYYKNEYAFFHLSTSFIDHSPFCLMISLILLMGGYLYFFL